jgi:hypothetical protein
VDGSTWPRAATPESDGGGGEQRAQNGTRRVVADVGDGTVPTDDAVLACFDEDRECHAEAGRTRRTTPYK